MTEFRQRVDQEGSDVSCLSLLRKRPLGRKEHRHTRTSYSVDSTDLSSFLSPFYTSVASREKEGER